MLTSSASSSTAASYPTMTPGEVPAYPRDRALLPQGVCSATTQGRQQLRYTSRRIPPSTPALDRYASHKSLPGVEPGEHVGRCQPSGARVVGSDLLVTENFTSRARGAAAEERDVALDNAGGRKDHVP